MEELRVPHNATVTEFLARTRITLENCLNSNSQDLDSKVEAILLEGWTRKTESDSPDALTIVESILATCLTLQEAKLRYSTLVDLARACPEFTNKWTKDAKLTTLRLKIASHYQINISRLNFAFQNLATLCGHGGGFSSALTKAGLLRALQPANWSKNGYERYKSLPPTTPLTR
jgi:hypothetical protein